MERFSLWDKNAEHDTKIEWYAPASKKTDAAVVIFPGGGYAMLAPHEGEGYVEYLNSIGITAFVVYYVRKNGMSHKIFSNWVRKETMEEMIEKAYTVRDRYTILTLIHDLELTKDVKPIIMERFF